MEYQSVFLSLSPFRQDILNVLVSSKCTATVLAIFVEKGTVYQMHHLKRASSQEMFPIKAHMHRNYRRVGES